MHINDTYALKNLLREIRAGKAVSMRVVDALIEAADEEVKQFEEMLETMALEEEARQGVEA